MEQINNYNMKEICVEQYCGTRYTHYEKLWIQGLCVYICLCEKHAEEWEVGR